MDDHDEIDSEDHEEQIEQMIIENGMLLHGVVNLLLQKGILKQEEIDAEMDKLYEAMEEFEDDDDSRE
jgi:hypothetical protein